MTVSRVLSRKCPCAKWVWQIACLYKLSGQSSHCGRKRSINRKWQEEQECVVRAMVCCIILLHACLTASQPSFPKGNAVSPMRVVETLAGLILDVDKSTRGGSRESQLLCMTINANNAVREEMPVAEKHWRARLASGTNWCHWCLSVRSTSVVITPIKSAQVKFSK